MCVGAVCSLHSVLCLGDDATAVFVLHASRGGFWVVSSVWAAENSAGISLLAHVSRRMCGCPQGCDAQGMYTCGLARGCHLADASL